MSFVNPPPPAQSDLEGLTVFEAEELINNWLKKNKKTRLSQSELDEVLLEGMIRKTTDKLAQDGLIVTFKQRGSDELRFVVANMQHSIPPDAIIITNNSPIGLRHVPDNCNTCYCCRHNICSNWK